MDESPDAREVTDAGIEGILRRVDPGLSPSAADPVERGFCSVYRLRVDEGTATRDLYLKCSPDGQRWAIPTEARITATLAAGTSIPVPEVLGAIDEAPDLPTPCYLTTGLPGAERPYEDVGRLDDAALRRLARETGRHLGELHSVPTPEFDGFGHVRHDGPALSGSRPSGDPAALTVGDPRGDWPSYLHERVRAALERHADSRFSELTPALHRRFRAGIADLEGPFDPVLGRNDHGLHNLLVDPGTGAVTGVLDWGYTLAVPAAFDLSYAVYLYGGSFLAGLPGVRGRRPLVRAAMAEGYRAATPEGAEVPAVRPLYEALAAVRIANDFERLDLPDGTASACADRVRADLRAFLDR